MSKSNSILTLSPMFLLFLMFLILRLTETIDWSWWWVTAPLWVPVAFFIAILAIALVFTIITALFAAFLEIIP